MTAQIRVVDTSAWIEWLTGSPLGKKLGKEFPDKPNCIVPTIVQLELSKWLVRELGEEQADQVIAYTQKCRVVPLDTAIALLATMGLPGRSHSLSGHALKFGHLFDAVEDLGLHERGFFETRGEFPRRGFGVQNCSVAAQYDFESVDLANGLDSELIDEEVDRSRQGFRLSSVSDRPEVESGGVRGYVHRPGDEPAKQVF